ncbi:MAG: site-specific integrase [Ruminiclostridium sp.]|nr:site-specific integrase [Ruminiclostridium sp.]
MPKNKKRDDGRVQSKVYLGIVDGKPRYKYVYAQNNRELEKKVQEVKHKLGKGLDLSAERDTFGHWAKLWLTAKENEVSAGRYVTYKCRYDNLAPLFDMEITKLRMSDFQSLIYNYTTAINKITGKPYAHATLVEIKNSASQIMKLAIENRVTDFNPVEAVKIPKTARKAEKRRALTDEEQRWIREFPHRAQTAAMIMMYAGLRRGELMALTWADIDLNKKFIRVERFVEIVKSKSFIKDYGKTDAAVRKVYIPDILVEYLQNVPGIHFGYVVQKQHGGLMTESAWKRMWSSYLTDLNIQYGNWQDYLGNEGKRPSKYDPNKETHPMIIPEFTAHWLRHTFITMMYLAGVDILTAKEQAGHKDIETTMSIYTHLNEEHKEKNITKLNTFIKDKQDTSSDDVDEA